MIQQDEHDLLHEYDEDFQLKIQTFQADTQLKFAGLCGLVLGLLMCVVIVVGAVIMSCDQGAGLFERLGRTNGYQFCKA